MPTDEGGEHMPNESENTAPAPPPLTRGWCATMDEHRRLLSESEMYARARSSIENNARARRGIARFTGVVHIPVVVHVLYANAAQNISDAQVQSQIDVLNRDYRATNPDVATVPPVFAPLVADSRVEFHLATTDPDGNPTTGITRTATTVASFGPTGNPIKFTAQGGHDAWPRDEYLNLWVGQLSSGLLGYAQFPGGPPETDGVVILHSAFGDTGTAAAPFNLGRTATHEVGHWLNLYHIWGDDGTGCSGSDEVDDTPNQASENYGTPTFPHVSCSNGPNGDLFMDYMDYVDDAAMVMFTRGQADRMAATLDGARSSFLGLPAPAAAVPEPAGPVVSWGPNRIDAFVIGTDKATYHKWWDGSQWGPSVKGYEYMGGVSLSAPEVAAWSADRLDVFVLGTDHALFHKWWDGTSWGPSTTGWETLGGICLEQPKVVTWGPNRLDVFVVGTDHALYHKWWDGSAWGPGVTDYEYQGGTLVGRPEAVAWGANRLDVFVVGTDSALYHKWWNGSQWGPSLTDFEYMGGTCSSDPTAVSWGANRLDVFVLGTDSAVYHKWWDGSAWGPGVTDYESLGGVCTTPPTVVSWGDGRLDLFVVGTDSALYHKWYDRSTGWGPSVTDWESLGGACVSPPRVTSWGPDRLDVFVEGTDGALYHKWWDGSAWGPSPTGFESLGGVISSIRTAEVPHSPEALGAVEGSAPAGTTAPTDA